MIPQEVATKFHGQRVILADRVGAGAPIRDQPRDHAVPPDDPVGGAHEGVRGAAVGCASGSRPDRGGPCPRVRGRGPPAAPPSGLPTREARRSAAITAARRLDVLAPMICAHDLARSAYSEGARDRSLFVSRGRFGARRGSAVGAGVAWWLGPGVTVPECRCSGFSRPRWIEESSLVVLPGPLSAATEIDLELAPDGVADATLESAQRLLGFRGCPRQDSNLWPTA
jgi:hypothetical protein